MLLPGQRLAAGLARESLQRPADPSLPAPEHVDATVVLHRDVIRSLDALLLLSQMKDPAAAHARAALDDIAARVRR